MVCQSFSSNKEITHWWNVTSYTGKYWPKKKKKVIIYIIHHRRQKSSREGYLRKHRWTSPEIITFTCSDELSFSTHFSLRQLVLFPAGTKRDPADTKREMWIVQLLESSEVTIVMWGARRMKTFFTNYFSRTSFYMNSFKIHELTKWYLLFAIFFR